MFRLLLGILVVAPLLAPADEEKRVADLYARGLAGEKQAVIDCIAALDATLARAPDDQLARVYLGSAWTLRSRDLPIGPAKLSALRRGIAFMDEAASAAPNDARVLLTRAVTNEALPGFLGRRKVARQQLDAIVRQIEQAPGKLGAADCQLLYLNAGQAARRAGHEGRAKELWHRGLTINADPKLSAEIRSALTK
ncbi:MAG TPA: hypothetical protein VGK72_05000 [Chthoniobacterales bacterium]